jgi:hypothetical protein
MFALLEASLGEMSAEILESQRQKTYKRQKTVIKNQREANQAARKKSSDGSDDFIEVMNERLEKEDY